MVDRKTKMSIRTSYVAHVDEELASEVKEEVFSSEYDHVFDFDMSEQDWEEVYRIFVKYFNGDVGVIVRNFDQADKDVKKDFADRFKSFYEGRPSSSETDILVTGSESPGTYNPDLAGRIVNLK